jgi:hypothetical protein
MTVNILCDVNTGVITVGSNTVNISPWGIREYQMTRAESAIRERFNIDVKKWERVHGGIWQGFENV